ncbi:hypothetical protein SDC9_185068 [bioreactor metagenome]|uniref:Uncharacterized protein n=1 Tax=bioreactor metagenome TaxID=1076179 RepID=A0A645HET1_9ZZZZ
MLQSASVERAILQISLHGVELRHGVAHRRSGREYYAAPACDFVHIAAFEEEVGGFLRLGLRDTGDISHLGKDGEVLKPVRLIHEEPIHAELFKRDHIVLARGAVELVELEFDRLSRALHLLDREALRSRFLCLGDTTEHLVELLL